MDIKPILETGKELAQKVLSNEQIMPLLAKAEGAAKDVPNVGGQLNKAVVLAELIVDYVNDRYTDVPKASIGAAALAFVYYILPIDIIPDQLPVIGKVDDALIAALCWGLVDKDIKKYNEWKNGNEITETE